MTVSKAVKSASPSARIFPIINDTEVDADERLSYHVYVYSRDEEMLKIVA